MSFTTCNIDYSLIGFRLLDQKIICLAKLFEKTIFRNLKSSFPPTIFENSFPKSVFKTILKIENHEYVFYFQNSFDYFQNTILPNTDRMHNNNGHELSSRKRLVDIRSVCERALIMFSVYTSAVVINDNREKLLVQLNPCSIHWEIFWVDLY